MAQFLSSTSTSTSTSTFTSTSTPSYKKIMVLKLFVSETDLELKEQYKIAIQKHNNKLKTDPFMDAGFDILTPTIGKDCIQSLNKIDFLVQCSAYILKKKDVIELPLYTGYYMYPRSSLSKTPLRLANSVGIIDSGYRGNLIGMFDCATNYVVKPFEKLLQICAPNLCPIYVIMVDQVEDLSEITSRGAGGFGSTTTC